MLWNTSVGDRSWSRAQLGASQAAAPTASSASGIFFQLQAHWYKQTLMGSGRATHTMRLKPPLARGALQVRHPGV